MPSTTPPPFSTNFKGENQDISEPWKQFLLGIQRSLVSGAAPSDAGYVVVEDNPDLTNEVNLGALVSGWLHSSVSAGLATVTSLPVGYTAMEPTVDVTIPANMGAIVPDHFTIAAGKVLTVAAGAVFQIT